MAITINCSGTISGISTGGLPDGSVTNDDLANSSVTVNGTSIALGGSENITAGKVLQDVRTHSTTTGTSTAASWTNSGISASITPSSTSSKILVIINSPISRSSDSLGGIAITRGGSRIGTASNSGSRIGAFANASTPGNDYGMESLNMTYLDSPATTSATTYSFQFHNRSGYGVSWNRTWNDNDASYTYRGATTITLLEIAS